MQAQHSLKPCSQSWGLAALLLRHINTMSIFTADKGENNALLTAIQKYVLQWPCDVDHSTDDDRELDSAVRCKGALAAATCAMLSVRSNSQCDEPHYEWSRFGVEPALALSFIHSL